jgi:TetR/AcrR family fatty acid metabolism transcriptional regulator
MPKIVKEQEREIMRRRLIQAAVEEFARVGFESTKIEQIAERAGIGKGTVYLYFASKQELFVGMLQEIGNAQLEALEQALADKTGLQAQLEALVEFFTRLGQEQPENLRIFVSALYGVNRQFKAEAAQSRKLFLKRVEKIINQAIHIATQGEPLVREVEPSALLILNMCQSLPLLAESLGFSSDYLQQHQAQIVTMLINSLHS